MAAELLDNLSDYSEPWIGRVFAARKTSAPKPSPSGRAGRQETVTDYAKATIKKVTGIAMATALTAHGRHNPARGINTYPEPGRRGPAIEVFTFLCPFRKRGIVLPYHTIGHGVH